MGPPHFRGFSTDPGPQVSSPATWRARNAWVVPAGAAMLAASAALAAVDGCLDLAGPVALGSALALILALLNVGGPRWSLVRALCGASGVTAAGVLLASVAEGTPGGPFALVAGVLLAGAYRSWPPVAAGILTLFALQLLAQDHLPFGGPAEDDIVGFLVLNLTAVAVAVGATAQSWHATTSELRTREAAREQVRARQGLMLRIAQAANAHETTTEAAQEVLDLLCDPCWPVAHLYLLEPNGHVLADTGVWSTRTHQGYPELVDATGADADLIDLASDHPLAKVARTGTLDRWKTTRDTPARRHAAEQLGLTRAIAAPLLAGDDVVGVFELYPATPEEPDDTARELLVFLGSVLGRTVDRERAARAELAQLDLQYRQRQAIELNDTVVQGVVATLYQLEEHDTAAATQTLRSTLVSARWMVSRLLSGGDIFTGAGHILTRDEPAVLDSTDPAGANR